MNLSRSSRCCGLFIGGDSGRKDQSVQEPFCHHHPLHDRLHGVLAGRNHQTFCGKTQNQEKSGGGKWLSFAKRLNARPGDTLQLKCHVAMKLTYNDARAPHLEEIESVAPNSKSSTVQYRYRR